MDMANTSNPVPSEPKLAEVPQHDFVDHWVGLTVEQEVNRGAHLRDIKTLWPKEGDKYCKLISDREPRHASSGSPESTGRGQSRTGRSLSPAAAVAKKKAPSKVLTHKSHSSMRSSNLRKMKCPLRIAELAAPTKRQCLATFRAKAHNLPDHMVERLKYHILEKGPLVKLNEAVECFKRHNRNTSQKSKRSNKSSGSSSKKKGRKRERTDIKYCCALFGSRVAHRLSYPLAISLIPELVKLSDIVYDEIDTLFKTSSIPLVFYEACGNKKMQTEISDKVTIWITSILEEASMRMTEEDLIAKERAKTQRLLLHYIDDQLARQRKELEEEEGPALDILDGIVGNVMDTCFPETKPEDTSTLSDPVHPESENPETYDLQLDDEKVTDIKADENGLSATELASATYDIDQTELAPAKSSTYNTEEAELAPAKSSTYNLEPTESAPAKSSTYNIEQMQDDPGDTKLNEDFYEAEHAKEDEKYFTILQDDKTEDNGSTAEPKESEIIRQKEDETIEQKEDPFLSLVDNADESHEDSPNVEPGTDDLFFEINEDNTVDQGSEDVKNPMNDNPDENVSDVFVDVDEMNKKVAFTINADVRGESVDVSIDNDSRINFEMFIQRINNPPQPVTYPKPDVSLSTPNEHLLCDADESWPEEPGSFMMRSIASVVKSVTSLGMIIEGRTGKGEPNSVAEDDLQLNSMLSEESVDNVNIDKEEPTKMGEETLRKTELNVNKDTSSDRLFKLGQGLVFTSDSVQTSNERLTKSDKTIVSAKPVNQPPEEQFFKLDDEEITVEFDEPKVSGSQDFYVPPNTMEEIGSTTSGKEDIQKGEGDHNDMESENNIIFEAIRQKMALATAEVKFDYKVHPNSAPAWALRNQSSDESIFNLMHGRCNRGLIAGKDKLTQFRLRKWCRDLERTVVNLEQWNVWLDGVCRQMFSLKQSGELKRMFSVGKKKADIKDWSTLKKTIDKEALLWRKLKDRTSEALKVYTFNNSSNNANSVNRRCLSPVVQFDFESDPDVVFKTMDNFDRQCILFHRMLVSTVYCMRCNCKNILKEKSTKNKCVKMSGRQIMNKR